MERRIDGDVGERRLCRLEVRALRRSRHILAAHDEHGQLIRRGRVGRVMVTAGTLHARQTPGLAMATGARARIARVFVTMQFLDVHRAVDRTARRARPRRAGGDVHCAQREHTDDDRRERLRTETENTQYARHGG